MSLISDVRDKVLREATAQEAAKQAGNIGHLQPYVPETPSTQGQAPGPANPLDTLASLYLAALNPGGGSAQQPQYVVTPTGPGTGGNLNLKPLLGLAVVGVVGFVGYKWYKKHYGGA